MIVIMLKLMMMVMMIVMMLMMLMVLPILILQPLVVKILIVQPLLLALLLFAGKTITLFVLPPEEILPWIDVLDRRIIAGNELFPMRMVRPCCDPTTTITLMVDPFTATKMTAAATAVMTASIETSGTGRSVRTTVSTDLTWFDPVTECFLHIRTQT